MNGFQRRDLLTLPAQRCTRSKIESLPFADKKRSQYIITAGRFRVKNRNILKATLFNAVDRAAEYLIFCDGGNNEFWTYDVLSHAWRDSMIQNIPADPKTPMLAIANDGGTAAAEYFGQPNRLASYCILDFQLNVRDMRGRNLPSGAKSRYYESRAYIDTVMEQAGQLPMDMEKFIDIRVLTHSRYIYYKRKGNTLNGYCSHCRTDVKLPVPKGAKKGSLNEVIAFCPHCRSKVRLKMAGRACKMEDSQRMEYIQRVADGFLVRSMVANRIHNADFSHPPKGFISEDFRTYFSFNGRIRAFEYYHHHVTGKNEWIFSNGMEPYAGVLYSENLTRIFRGTKFQHSGLPEYIKKDTAPLRSDCYLERYLSAPALELIAKIGMTRLVRDAIGGRYGSGLRFEEPNGTSPTEALGVNRRELRELRALNISGEGLTLWKDLKKAGYAVNTEMIQRFWKFGITNFWSVDRASKYGDILKTMDYMQNQGEQARSLNDWADYLENCKKLDYDITEKHVKYPREFRKMHDRVAEEVVNRQNKSNCQAFLALYQKYSKIYGYEDRNYIVMLPKTPGELIREGNAMHHCVGTYIDRVAKKKSIILFIRRKEAPDEPFITAEVSPENRPVQIQDKYDKEPPEDVMRFWKKYQQVVLAAAAAKSAKNRKAG